MQPSAQGSGVPLFQDYSTELTSASTFPATFGANGANMGLAVAPATVNPRLPTWMQALGAGTATVIWEDGTQTTLNFNGADPPVPATFRTIVSMTVPRLRVGASAAPPAPIPSAVLVTAFSSATAITAGTTRTQAGATPMANIMNRVDTSTAPSAGTITGDGVALMASGPGKEQIVINNTANPIQVWPLNASGDTINGLGANAAVVVLPSDVARFESPAAGAWYFEAGYGYNGILPTELACDAISAAGANQAAATPLPAALNTVSTVGAGQGVALVLAFPGLSQIVQNTGANPLLVYAKNGSSDTINGLAGSGGVQVHPGTVAVFNATALGAWNMQSVSPRLAAFNTASNTTSFTATGANITGGVASVDLALTGTLGSGQNITLPTVANTVLAMHAPAIGSSFRLRIINESGGAFAWTVVTDTGWTLTGTMTIAQNTWREFVVTLNTLTTATLQSVATGTFS